MTRAATQMLRDSKGGWKPVGVWFATKQAIQSRFLPGVEMEDFERRQHESMYRPTLDDGRQGTWEDWLEYALDALSNGHDLMLYEVEPELTVDLTYARDVLDLDEEERKSWKPSGVPNITTVPIGDLKGPAAGG